MLIQPQKKQLILFVGIPATGKSSFYKAYFYDTHMRINRDMLKTKHREKTLFNTCLSLEQSVVIDNTNVTKQMRQYFITQAKQADFSVTCCYFESKIHDALARNAKRTGKQRIPDSGLLGMYARLELPDETEAFDAIYYIQMTEDGFKVSDWAV